MLPPTAVALQARSDYNVDTSATSLTAAAFLGIAWYLCLELNVRLFLRFTRHSLYFWSCLLCSWGIILHGLMIAFADFGVWFSYASVILITIFWCIFVVSHSVMIYTRLSMVLDNDRIIRCVLYLIIFTGVVFGLGSVILGIVAKQPAVIDKIRKVSLLWDKIEVAAFFIQETIIGILYIRATASHLKNQTLLGSNPEVTRRNLRNLVALNIFTIILDCSLIGLCYAGFFDLQGFYKIAVYSVKLRAEFSILNAVRTSIDTLRTPRLDSTTLNDPMSHKGSCTSSDIEAAKGGIVFEVASG